MLFHIALVLLIIGHLELFADFKIFQIIPHEVFLGRGFVGLTLSVGLALFSVPAVRVAGEGTVGSGRLLSF